MKKLPIYLLLFIISFSAAAKEYYDAEIFYLDGSSRVGLADMIEDGGDKTIEFKSEENAAIEIIESDRLSKIVYTIDGEKYEYNRLKVYTGWKQEDTTDEAGWLQLVQKGIATLYINQTVMYSRNQYGQATGSATFKDYYIIREGEIAAKLIATISSFNNNQTFKAKAPLYFADYPDLAKKIKNKTYTWKDLFEVVDIYNEWAEQQINN
jgi:hypothetical protein